MKKYLLRIGLATSLLFGFLLGSAVKAQGAVASCQQDEQQVKSHNGWIHHLAEEPESVPIPALRPSTPSHRVASHRSVRLQPTHGGKPSQHSGRWAKDPLSHLIKYILHPCIGHHRLCMVASSPRRYYVIALRRLLC